MMDGLGIVMNEGIAAGPAPNKNARSGRAFLKIVSGQFPNTLRNLIRMILSCSQL